MYSLKGWRGIEPGFGVWVRSGVDGSGVRGRRAVCEMGMMKESSLPGHAWPLRPRTEVKYPLQKSIVRFVMGHPRKNVPCVQLRDSDESEFAIVVEAGAMRECLTIRNGFCEEWIDVEYEDIEQLEIMFRVQKGGVEIGRLAILGTDLRERQGSLRKPLMENSVIGYLTIDYLVVTNLPAAEMATVEDGISNVRAPRFVGHRGSGAKGTSPYMENTVLSFVNATRTSDVTHVELDVQLTRDGVPVIFHDFHVPLKTNDEKASCMVPICSMTSQQFVDLDPAVLCDDDTHLSDDDSTLRSRTSVRAPFKKPRARVELGGPVKDLMPKLADICNECPVEIGLMIELKYPTLEYLEEYKIHFPSRNLFADRVLETVLETEGNSRRSIIFLTFDADLAMIFRAKQSRYPVYFLSEEYGDDSGGATTEYYDWRCIRGENAVDFAKAVSLQGNVFFVDVALQKPYLVERAHQKGLVLMTYGKANSNSAIVEKQLQLKVDGVIADNVNLLTTELLGTEANESEEEKTAKISRDTPTSDIFTKRSTSKASSVTAANESENASGPPQAPGESMTV
ncbi:hypothetical protein NDN08_006493 [Rhodosorus marinus]|uniref:GP-PDE domain-containing protein n=1 Tax=Rhodosorus marinus TaxID=101924 RepID=A0AAV8UHS7_9RHOD|nr:hypothetical protein NDN08_006493 [Rhodosorus marinus]